MKRAVWVLVLVFALAACSRGQPQEPPPRLTPLGHAEGSLTRVKDRPSTGLRGFRVEAQPGDWMLRSAGKVAVISVLTGQLIDFGAEGGEDALVFLEPLAFRGIDPERVVIERIEPVAADVPALYMVKRLAGRKVRLHSWLYFSGGTLTVESALSAEAPEPAIAWTLGESVGWGNVPTFVEGHGFVKEAGSYTGAFMARDSLGTAYALCSRSGPTNARIPLFDLPGFYESPQTGEDSFVLDKGGLSARRTIFLTHSTRSLGEAILALPCMSVRGAERWGLPAGLPAGLEAEVVTCEAPARPYLRFRLEKGASSLSLPRGCLRVRFTAFGHAPGGWVDPEKLKQSPSWPQAGRLAWKVAEGNGSSGGPTIPGAQPPPLPARVLVRGLDGTPDPTWGEDPDRGAALNVVYSDTGSGERPLPPGAYRVIIDRGFEYSLHQQDVTISAGSTARVTAYLRREVDTRGFLAADLHLHAVPSPDAPALLADRIRSLVAVGVEVGVATDHNAVTDYSPIIRELGLTKWMASVVGDEVTTKETLFGHFNVFPILPGAAPIEYRNTSPHAIVAASRAMPPYGPRTLVQVNHPRMRDLGYFELLRFDPRDVHGWKRRTPLADMGFDAIEVFNGDHYADIPRVEECLRDWYALLNAGYRYTATGNSDSHKLTYHEAGAPRNLVAVPNDDPSAFDERAFVESIRKGRVVVSSGPFIRLTANDKGLGETVPAGEVEIAIRVEAPGWVDVDRVQLLRRGELLREWTAPFGYSPRFERRTKVSLRPGDWVIAIARGSKPMAHLHRSGATPYAFTNPIFVK
jgi:hypothetical protein